MSTLDTILPDERRMLAETAQRFLEREAPVSSARDGLHASDSWRAGYWKKAAALGWTSMLLPERLGGTPTDEPIVDLAVIAETVGRFVAPGPLLACNVVIDAIVRSGSPEQQAQYLPGLTEGELTAAWAFAEDGCWESAGLEFSIRREGESLVLNGGKQAIEEAERADIFLVSGRDEDGNLCQVLVPRDTAGTTVAPLDGLDLNRRYGQLSCTNVRMPATALVGAGRADQDIARQMLLALTLQSAETVGLVDAMFAATIEYTQNRYAFGRPLASYQALKHRLADHKVALESALAISAGLARAVNEGDPAAAELASAAKAHIGDQSLTILSDCAQLFGGIAMTWEHDLHVYLRRATVNNAVYGDSVLHRELLCRIVGV